MRKFIFFIFLFNFLAIKSQEIISDTISDLPSIRVKPYEIAYTFFAINLKNEIKFSNSNEPTLEFLNGILVRYKFNRLSLRINASIAKINREYLNIYDVTDYSYAKAQTINYKIGIGTQITPLKKKEFIYSYVDISYKKRNENGLIIDTKTTSATYNNYHTTTSGLDLILGIGSKVKLYKCFYISGEVGYNYYLAESKIKNIDISTKQSCYHSIPITFHTILGKFYLSLIF